MSASCKEKKGNSKPFTLFRLRQRRVNGRFPTDSREETSKTKKKKRELRMIRYGRKGTIGENNRHQREPQLGKFASNPREWKKARMLQADVQTGGRWPRDMGGMIVSLGSKGPEAKDRREKEFKQNGP